MATGAPDTAIDFSKLNKKDRAIIAYWLGASTTSAVVQGGYTPACQKHVHKSIFNDARARALIGALSEQCLEDLKLRRGKLIAELETIAYSDLKDYVKVSNGSITSIDLPADKSQAVKSVKETRNGLEIVMHDKISAIEKLAKISGLMLDRVDITTGGQPLQNRTPVNIVFEVIRPNDPKDVTGETNASASLLPTG